MDWAVRERSLELVELGVVVVHDGVVLCVKCFVDGGP